jgi:hypothetical protein
VQSHGTGLWNSNLPIVSVSDLRSNLEAFLRTRLKVSAGKFGKLAPLKLLSVSKRRGFVSQLCEISA